MAAAALIDEEDGDLIKAFNNPAYSNLTVRCGGKEWKVSSSIICSQSDFFQKAFEADFAEKKTGIIELPEDDPEEVEILLRFLHGARSWAEQDYWDPPTIDHAKLLCRLYLLGDKLLVKNFKEATERSIITVAENIVDPHNIQSLLELIHAVSQLPDRPMKPIKTVLNAIAVVNIRYLRNEQSFHALLSEDPELATMIAKRSLDGDLWGPRGYPAPTELVMCNSTECDSHYKSWCIGDGPEWLVDTYCI